jgi:hypothetical protein
MITNFFVQSCYTINTVLINKVRKHFQNEGQYKHLLSKPSLNNNEMQAINC